MGRARRESENGKTAGRRRIEVVRVLIERARGSSRPMSGVQSSRDDDVSNSPLRVHAGARPSSRAAGRRGGPSGGCQEYRVRSSIEGIEQPEWRRCSSSMRAGRTRGTSSCVGVLAAADVRGAVGPSRRGLLGRREATAAPVALAAGGRRFGGGRQNTTGSGPGDRNRRAYEGQARAADAPVAGGGGGRVGAGRGRRREACKGNQQLLFCLLLPQCGLGFRFRV